MAMRNKSHSYGIKLIEIDLQNFTNYEVVSIAVQVI